MKKIMFNDKYGLTRAVLEGRKTMTRRIATYDEVFAPSEYLNEWKDSPRYGHTVLVDGCAEVATSQYKEGDVLAVAQNYNDAGYAPNTIQRARFKTDNNGGWQIGDFEIRLLPGWKNKMYTYPSMMPHRIRITTVSTQRLQDISEEDCLREGVMRYTCNLYEFRGICYSFDGDKAKMGTYLTARGAFAALIDKVSGKGTWAANPWVFVYSFEFLV